MRHGVNWGAMPSELGLPGDLAHSLSNFALLTWSAVLGYGLALETLGEAAVLCMSITTMSMCWIETVEF